MPGNWSLYRTWSDGQEFNGADITASFQTVLTNATPSGLDDYSNDVTQMRSTVDPYPASVESLATSTAGELERIRYILKNVFGWSQWYTHTSAIDFGTRQVTIANAQVIIEHEMFS